MKVKSAWADEVNESEGRMCTAVKCPRWKWGVDKVKEESFKILAKI
jgi:hypothetical protein